MPFQSVSTAAAVPARRVGIPGRRLLVWATGIALASAIPRLLTAGQYVTTDEPTWLRRSTRFSDAIAHGNFSRATASLGEPATMPGGPTMWVGSMGRVVWNLAHDLGVVDSESFASADGLAICQVLVALVTSMLIGVLFVAVARWVGVLAAFFGAVLVATEPWIVSLGSLLHTDELTALFGTIGLVLLAHALGIPDPERTPRRPKLVAALAGMLLMASALTKVTGVGYWTGAAVLALWAIVRARGELPGGVPVQVTPQRLCVIAAAAGLVVVPFGWPAVVVDPLFQWGRLVAAAGLSTKAAAHLFGLAHRQFFLGEPIDDPPWFYYAVALPLRTTPWSLIAVAVAVPIALWRATSRRYALVFVAPAVSLVGRAVRIAEEVRSLRVARTRSDLRRGGDRAGRAGR